MITYIINLLNEKVISTLVPLLLFGASIYFFIILKFFPVFKAKQIVKSLKTKSQSDGIHPLKALCLALAGTLGVGNIAGVASAIITGGAGALFWMCVSSLIVTILKYCEITLAVKTRITVNGEVQGGAMYYIKGRVFPIVFAFLCIVSSFAIGNLLQTNSSAKACASLGISPVIIGILFAGFCFIITSNGMNKAVNFCFAAVPFMCVLYILMCLWVIISHFGMLSEVFSEIVTDAFNIRSAYGGMLGFIMSKNLRIGVARGLVTNESGCGSAPMAHASAKCEHAAAQGFLGIFEVLADTILCIFTGVTILLAFNGNCTDGMSLVISVFEGSMGSFANILLSIELFMFSLATLIGWSCYGVTALKYITKSRFAEKLYHLLFSLCAFVGVFVSPSFIWSLSDLAFGLMTIINLFALVKSSSSIKRETADYFRLSS